MRDSALRPKHTASLTIEVRNASTGELTPARVYLFRSERPHRLSPVDNLLPLFEDNFHRERIWQMTDRPRTLEINVKNQWHHLLLEGAGTFDVPAWADYRVEAYHGLFWEPGAEKTVVVKVKPITPGRRGLRFESESQREKLMRLAKRDAAVAGGAAADLAGEVGSRLPGLAAALEVFRDAHLQGDVGGPFKAAVKQGRPSCRWRAMV